MAGARRRGRPRRDRRRERPTRSCYPPARPDRSCYPPAPAGPSCSARTERVSSGRSRNTTAPPSPPGARGHTPRSGREHARSPGGSRSTSRFTARHGGSPQERPALSTLALAWPDSGRAPTKRCCFGCRTSWWWRPVRSIPMSPLTPRHRRSSSSPLTRCQPSHASLHCRISGFRRGSASGVRLMQDVNHRGPHSPSTDGPADRRRRRVSAASYSRVAACGSPLQRSK